jgi:AcrR family transcriptional regulator
VHYVSDDTTEHDRAVSHTSAVNKPTDLAPQPFDEVPAADGRVARGQRTRRKVVEALVSLLRDGNPDPTAKVVAERAGVSLRLIFHHFSDMDDLYRAVGAFQLERHWFHLPEVAQDLSLPLRIARTVEHRSVLYEEISPVRRAAVRRSGGSTEVASAIAYTNALLMENLATAFVPELQRCPADERSDILAAADAASSWETWERLRRNSNLSVDGATRIMDRTLTALFMSGAVG